MTDHADTIRRPERLERVEEWANLYGNDLEGILRLDPESDAATLAAIDDALMLVEDVYALLAERQQAQAIAARLFAAIERIDAALVKLGEKP